MSNYSTIQYINNDNMNNNLNDSISIESINTLTETAVENNISEISNLSVLKTSQESEKKKSESEGNIFKELDDSYDFEPRIVTENNNDNNIVKKVEKFSEVKPNNDSVNTKLLSVEESKEKSNEYTILIILLLALLFFYFVKKKSINKIFW